MNILNYYVQRNWVTAVCSLILVIACLIAAYIFYTRKHLFLLSKNRNIACVALLVLAFIMLVSAVKASRTKHVIYEVVVDESFSAVKLYDDYIVKDKRGELWVLEKR